MPAKISKLLSIVFAIFIFALSFFVRFFNIGLLPINHDEANWARFLLEKPGLIKNFFGIPIISFSFLPYSIRSFLTAYISNLTTFNLNEFMLHMRFQSVVIGAATVLLAYILARQMYGQKTAIISSLLLCFLPWHIIHSRIMGQVIWVPLFGCLTFLSLFKAIQGKNRIWAGLWFLFALFFLKESLKGYGSAILFIPIFFVSLICLSKEIKHFVRSKTILIAMLLIAFLFILPFVHKILRWRAMFREGLCPGYYGDVFGGSLFFNLLGNFKNNIGPTFQQLFFTHQSSSFLYGQALGAPLLIHPIVFILFLTSLAFAIWKRKAADKILLVWLCLGLLGVIMGVSLFQARYILIILPPLLILIARFMAEMVNKISFSRSPLVRKALLITAAILFLGIINVEIAQWLGYYYSAPFDFEECRHNSYGCKEAAEYLSKLPSIENYNIYIDTRMTVDVYLNYYLLLDKAVIDKCYELGIFHDFFILYRRPDKDQRGKREEISVILYRRPDKDQRSKREEIFVLWAPESHPEDYWDSFFRHSYDSFKQRYPEEIPTKTIYYPNGFEAIHIFKVKRNDV